MNKHSILFIGLDTHTEFIEIAYIEDSRGSEVVQSLLRQQPAIFSFDYANSRSLLFVVLTPATLEAKT